MMVKWRANRDLFVSNGILGTMGAAGSESTKANTAFIYIVYTHNPESKFPQSLQTREPDTVQPWERISSGDILSIAGVKYRLEE